MRTTEFLKQFDAEMSVDDLEAIKLRFKLIDADNSGFIDWDEYLNYECMRRLSKRHEVCLMMFEVMIKIKLKYYLCSENWYLSFHKKKFKEHVKHFLQWIVIKVAQYQKKNLDDRIGIGIACY